MPIFNIKNDFSELSVTTDGGTMLSWKTKDQEILYQGSSDRRSGIPILFPFANPLKDNIFVKSGLPIGQHGFARNSAWHFKQVSQSQVELTLTNNDISPEMQLAYPFQFNLNITLNIETKGVLDYTILLDNLDEKPMPIAPGLHPYFPIKHDQKTQLKISNLDLQNIDWNKESEGNFYDFDGEAIVEFPNGKVLKITETSEIKDFQNLVIWSQTPAKEDSDFVCLEPFSRQTNAINDNPILVEPRGIWEKSFEFIITD